MSSWRRLPYKSAAKRRTAIANYYRKKATAALIPDQKRVPVPRVKSEWIIRFEHRSGHRASFRCYMMPWGKLDISPTLAGQKVACVLKNFKP